MTPLPPPLGNGDIVAWRLDQTIHGSTWDSGEGAFRAGGRWNSTGVRAVYCSFDPSTAILEGAVHKGFRVLDTVPHVLTSLRIPDPADIEVIDPSSVPNPNWLTPGIPSAGQQVFGDRLLRDHAFIMIPSAVSRCSWNVIFDGQRAKGRYLFLAQQPFALDTRLHPPPTS